MKILYPTDENVKNIVELEIIRLGNDADLNHIDVSNITNMNNLFMHSQFNGDISKWNVSNVTSFRNTFMYSKFNRDISNWNVTCCDDFGNMFAFSLFNRDLNNWNILTNAWMHGIFSECPYTGPFAEKKYLNGALIGNQFSDEYNVAYNFKKLNF
jgi:surface protein